MKPRLQASVPGPFTLVGGSVPETVAWSLCKTLICGLRLCGQSTVNKRAPIHCIIPVNDMVDRPLQKIFSTLPTYPAPNLQVRSVKYTVAFLNKIDEVSILQPADRLGNPSFHTHAPDSKRRYPCTETASAVQK